MAAGAMSCPKCDQPLVRVATPHAVFWRCEGCRGTAIGLDALRRTFERGQINAVWQRARTEHGSPAAACPSCRNQMIEVAATEQPEPRIEVCRICHFLWFDADELTRLTPLPPPAQSSKQELSPDARQALAIAELELMREQSQTHGYGAGVAADFWSQIAQLLLTAKS